LRSVHSRKLWPCRLFYGLSRCFVALQVVTALVFYFMAFVTAIHSGEQSTAGDLD
jgi:hypothetical protein